MTASSAPHPAVDPSLLAPEYIRSLGRYVPGKPVGELAREFGLTATHIVKLASNENPRGPSPAVRAAIAAATDEVCRYPDGDAFELKAALSARLRVSPFQLVLGNGSNDVLELATQARGATGIEVPARDYGHDLAAMRSAITPQTRIVFIANPNNPTGTWIASEPLRAFIASVPANVLVVLDEAYNEYLESGERAESAAWIAEHPNLIISRTFSKAYGLAALRVGYGVMDAKVADMMNRVRQPFNVNALAQAAAVAALADTGYVDESRALNTAGIQQLCEGVRALGLEYVASHANFLLVRVGDGAAIYQRLLEQGVIVRPVAGYGLPEFLRVTVGLPAENRRFLDAMAAVLAR